MTFPTDHPSEPDDVTTAPPERGVWEGWEPGVRVMVRTRLPAGSTHLYTDVLGTVTARTADALTLETRSGTVEVPVGTIATGKVVPPAPARRRPRDG
ncbi:hypothetical protein Sked_26020 [Sanguibacter keddieii DSM 10542]|uniref:Histone acetyltransferase Rv0428c-like SH3 domain-containing protein n=1 Tax=Sanguibacter keddieii (strain ATCC 51767 / DSM 10542 / NCFB 3025 / ST-74) TaxID=446469 RepID=D1BKM9_SANKS|nr:hypothetical protein [Sanguibacter keddieii]ACZ22506.1 hypothetical protein Sked_26020 [Sanguibacter keddieii DSM 10542]